LKRHINFIIEFYSEIFFVHGGIKEEDIWELKILEISSQEKLV
jgi:hypothetical protein